MMTASSISILALLFVAAVTLMPPIGAFFLWLAAKLLKVEAPYLRCWWAYFLAYLLASIVATLLVNVVRDDYGPSNSVWGIAMLFGLGIHFIVVPAVLRTGYRGRVLAAQLLGILGAGVTTVICLLPFAWYARAQALQVQRQYNLRAIGRAIADFEQTTQNLPPAASTSGGRALLSWRVHLLPYLERQSLFEQFKQDEPWDSPHNKSLIEFMPREYCVPGADPKQGLTHYRGFSSTWASPQAGRGGHAAFLDPGTSAQTQGWKFSQLRDGRTQTILVLEVQEPIVWTKPDNLPLPESDALPALDLPSDLSGFFAVFADNHVEWLPRAIPAADLRALLTIDGNEPPSERR